jgi:hypothetical protein
MVKDHIGVWCDFQEGVLYIQRWRLRGSMQLSDQSFFLIQFDKLGRTKLISLARGTIQMDLRSL